jgi:hypothetical protein
MNCTRKITEHNRPCKPDDPIDPLWAARSLGSKQKLAFP